VQGAQRTSPFLNGKASNSGCLVEERIFDQKTQAFADVIARRPVRELVQSYTAIVRGSSTPVAAGAACDMLSADAGGRRSIKARQTLFICEMDYERDTGTDTDTACDADRKRDTDKDTNRDTAAERKLGTYAEYFFAKAWHLQT